MQIKLRIIFCDDGVNAAGGNERENVEMHNITGGLIYISAQGDVIDSNGNIEMSGVLSSLKGHHLEEMDC